MSALLLDEAIADDRGGLSGRTAERLEVEQEFNLFREALGDFKFAVTQPYWTVREKKQKGSGGLLSITVNPYTCKGCMECVKVCNDDALRPVTQTPESVDKLRKDWDFWQALPTTPPEFIRIENLDEKIGALETLLLDKRNYLGMVAGDGACLGCGEKIGGASVHRDRGSADAAARSEAGSEDRRADREARSACPAEARRHDGPER